jgi:septal ring factor EnvC (AmiA/AmiB activator)
MNPIHATIAFALLSVCLGTAIAQTTPTRLEEVRTNIDKWVETRQLLAKTRSEWASEQETLRQSISLIEKEIKLIDERITQTRETASQADRDRLVLNEENERLSQAATTVQKVLADLEQQTTNLAAGLPLPLQERIMPLLKRIPNQPSQTRLSISERMQSIVGVLSEVDKFNNAVSLFTELRKNSAGAEIQVKTLYVGLGVAFFADKNGDYGGVGVPGPTAWEWTPKPEFASDIARAIAIYENTETAQFVKLPVTVK